MIAWIKKLISMVANHDKEVESLRREIAEARRVIQERTSVSVDVNFKSANHVIVVGQYKGCDFVQAYSIDRKEIAGVVELLRDMERFGQVKRVDAIPSFSAVIKRSI